MVLILKNGNMEIVILSGDESSQINDFNLYNIYWFL